MTTFAPPKIPACFPVSVERNLNILDDLDVEHHWLPGSRLTHCNQAVEAALEALGVHIRKGLLANEQQAWFQTVEGAVAGWELVATTKTHSALEHAANNADLGIVTVATLHEEPHGHIAIVRGTNERGQALIWQAGARNYRAAPITVGFGAPNLPHIKFFSCTT